MKFNTKLLPGITIISFFEVLCKLTKISKKHADSHFEENRKKWAEYRKTHTSKYLEDQHDFAMLQYGRYNKFLNNIFMKGRPINASANTCGVLATFNVLKYLGDDNDDLFPELLNAFETRCLVLKGYFGTSFVGILNFLKKKGYESKLFIGRKVTKENMDYLENEYGAFILLAYNNAENVADMIHYISITKEENGFVKHNSYDQVVCYPTLYEAVINYNRTDSNKSKPIGVAGVRKLNLLNKEEE